MAEKTQPQDLLSGDVLLLASSTWNTGGIEGQLNPHMWRCSMTSEDSGLGRQTVWRASDLGTIDTSTRRERRIICSTTLRPITVD